MEPDRRRFPEGLEDKMKNLNRREFLKTTALGTSMLLAGGWMTVEKWDKIKDDPTQWSEYHVRKKMLSQ